MRRAVDGAAYDVLTLVAIFALLVLGLLADVDTNDTSAVLLVVAQSLFMLLPIGGLNGMREGRPTQVTCAKITTHIVASLGFITLIAMFTVKEAALGVKLCFINLILRIGENVRIYQLHLRYVHPIRKAPHIC
jgi:hypothetical protein